MKYKNKILQISCDGGAATGKSTGAKMISKKYNLQFLSSGLLYRYASYLILKHFPRNEILFINQKFKNLNYKKILKINLHTPQISSHSAQIARKPRLRKILKKFQLNFAKKNKRCCIEGRDISSNILPRSNVKFYFKCNLNTASQRRYKELKKNNKSIKLLDVKKALKLRNISDKKRKHSPLKKAKNAVLVDTTRLNKQAMLNKMIKHVERVLK